MLVAWSKKRAILFLRLKVLSWARRNSFTADTYFPTFLSAVLVWSDVGGRGWVKKDWIFVFPAFESCEAGSRAMKIRLGADT